METASKSSLAFAILLTLQLADMYKPKSCSIIYLNSRNRKPSFPVRKKIWSNTFSSGMDDSWKYILFKGRKTVQWNHFVSLIFCRLKRTGRFFCYLLLCKQNVDLFFTKNNCSRKEALRESPIWDSNCVIPICQTLLWNASDKENFFLNICLSTYIAVI